MNRLIAGRIVTPETILEDGWITVENGRITAIRQGPRPEAMEVDDYGQALILPGVIDGQTHATSYRGLAGIEETTAAAIAGGCSRTGDGRRAPGGVRRSRCRAAH